MGKSLKTRRNLVSIMIAVAMAFSIAGGLALTAFADTQAGGGNAQPNADYIPALFAADAPGAHELRGAGRQV